MGDSRIDNIIPVFDVRQKMILEEISDEQLEQMMFELNEEYLRRKYRKMESLRDKRVKL